MRSETGDRLPAIEEHVREILKILKVDLNAQQFRDTPRRIARMAFELLAGMDKRNAPKLTLFRNTGYRDILIVNEMPFYSLCAHHSLPMFGHVSVAYIPGRKMVGLSKLPRVVKFFSARLQVQEDFAKELADYLHRKLEQKEYSLSSKPGTCAWRCEARKLMTRRPYPVRCAESSTLAHRRRQKR